MAIVVITAIVNPWLLIPAIIMTILFHLMRVLFVKTGRGFKRIEALSKYIVRSTETSKCEFDLNFRS